MTIGQRLRRAMVRRGLTQVEVARRSGLQTATVSDIVNDRSQPSFDTVARMVAAIGTTWGELFDEPQLQLSYDDAAISRDFRDVLQRLLENVAAQALIRERAVAPRKSGQRKSRPSSVRMSQGAARPDIVRDSPVRIPLENHEVENLPNERIPEPYYRQGARRAFRVLTDAMIEAGILQGSILYTRTTQDLASADGEVIVCMLNGTLYLKRLDLRGQQTTLESTNPRYPTLTVDRDDQFTLSGVVVTLSEA